MQSLLYKYITYAIQVHTSNNNFGALSVLNQKDLLKAQLPLGTRCVLYGGTHPRDVNSAYQMKGFNKLNSKSLKRYNK